MKNQRYESTPNRSINSNGWIPVAFVFDIFLPPTVRKPCAQTCIGGSTPAAINIAGQYTACCRRMSFPIEWMFAGHTRAKRSGSSAYPAAVM